jgi:hypothetical protein
LLLLCNCFSLFNFICKQFVFAMSLLSLFPMWALNTRAKYLSICRLLVICFMSTYFQQEILDSRG